MRIFLIWFDCYLSIAHIDCKSNQKAIERERERL